MSKEIIKYNDDELTKIRVKAQNFQKRLHKSPPATEVKRNKHANNSYYVPISFLEMNMDEMFFGLWETKNFKYQVVANEIIGDLELRFFHPVYNSWVSRVGAASVMIQYKSIEKGGSGEITNIEDKIKNTLVKDFPHLKAECFRNACLSIGKLFGRDLNRDFEDQYQPIIKESNIEDELLKELEGLHPQKIEDDKVKIRDKYFKKGLSKPRGIEIIEKYLAEL